MWYKNKKGEKEFVGGKEDWKDAAQEAKKCFDFKPDVEDEWVADDLRSCYNCRFRRWTERAFVCVK
jgi:hypothetical protein